MIKIKPKSIHGKYGMPFGKTHLFTYSAMLGLSSQEHQTRLFLTTATCLTPLQLTLSQCALGI